MAAPPPAQGPGGFPVAAMQGYYPASPQQLQQAYVQQPQQQQQQQLSPAQQQYYTQAPFVGQAGVQAYPAQQGLQYPGQQALVPAYDATAQGYAQQQQQQQQQAVATVGASGALPGAQPTVNVDVNAVGADGITTESGFWGRMFGGSVFGRKLYGDQPQLHKNTGDEEQGADPALSHVQPVSMFQGDLSREVGDTIQVSYDDTVQFPDRQPEVQQVQAAVYTLWDTGYFGPRPTPKRLEVTELNHEPREDYGFFVRRSGMGAHSLFKMEQRLLRMGTLNRGAVAALLSGQGSTGILQVAPPRPEPLTLPAPLTPQPKVQPGSLGHLEQIAEEGEDGAQAALDQQQQQQFAMMAQQQQQFAFMQQQQQQQQQGPMPNLPGMIPTAGDAQPQFYGTPPGMMQQQQQMALMPMQGMQQQPGSMMGPAPGWGLSGLPPGVMGAPMGSPGDIPPGMFGFAPQPGGIVVLPDGTVVPAPDAPPYAKWMDEDRLMVYIGEPLKEEKERPWRRYDQDKESIKTHRRYPIVEAHAGVSEGSKTYRLDIELGRLEFLVHPAMKREDLLAAKLLAAFREFKRREALGLVSFYANRLAALEESLLAARERLFSATADEAVEEAEVLRQMNKCGAVEREVAEMRQLKEEEEVLMWRSAAAMQQLFSELSFVRQQQGYWATNLELAVLQKPPEELQWSMGVGVSRDRLDIDLMLAESEAIAGLPPPPYALPVPQWDLSPATGGLGLFRPRRLETLCAAHKALYETLKKRLSDVREALATAGVPEGAEPAVGQIEAQLAALGPAPRRIVRSPVELQAARAAAQQRLAAADVGVLRVPVLTPVLSVAPEGPGEGHIGQQPGSASSSPPGSPSPGAPPPGFSAPPGSPGGIAVGVAPRQTGGRRDKRPRYTARLYVNGKLLDASEAVPMGDITNASSSFVCEFRETFSVGVVRWPESISVQVWEVGALRDSFVSQVFIAIPGLAGSPHVDAQPKQYQFISQAPFRVRGSTSLPAAAPGPSGIHGVSAAPGPGGDANPANLVYPAGAMFVRCGWVSEVTKPGTRLEDAASGGGKDLSATSQGASGAAVGGAAVTAYLNPLADGDDDVEAGNGIDSGRKLMPPMPQVTIGRMLRRAAERIGASTITRAQVMRWLSNNLIDPLDPRNAALVELLKAQEAQSGSAMDGIFRLDVSPSIALQPAKPAAKRTDFLARRWRCGPYRDPNRSVLQSTRSVAAPVTLSDKDANSLEGLYLDSLQLLEMAPGGVGPVVARALLARQERALQMQTGPALARAVEDREARIKAFSERVHAAAVRLARGKQVTRRYTTDDVVNDAPLPDFKVEWKLFANLFEARRPLRRKRKAAKSVMTSVPKDTELLVTIQRCSNLPARAKALPEPGPDGEPPRVEPGAGSKGLRCFVEVVYRTTVLREDEHGKHHEERYLRRRTAATDEDEFPVFNEHLSLPMFGVGEEPSPSAINETNHFVTINVFDEYINERVTDLRSTLHRDNGVSEPVRFPERERRFLGCVRIPLSAVYQLQVLEGVFKLEAPPVVLGYRQVSDRPPCVHMSMTLRPSLVPPTALEGERISGEADDITQLASRWQAGALAQRHCVSRVIKSMGVDADGTSILVTRFVSPTPLPPALHQLAMSPEASMSGMPQISITELIMIKMARFVSLIPYMEDSGLSKKRGDVWCTSSEFLHMAAGDSEEHAHLLAGFFMELGQQAFIVMGASTLGARSAFVLTTGARAYDPNNPLAGAPPEDLDETKLRLWNPITGSCTHVKDSTCDMRQVGMIYDHTNMWANVQLSAQPWDMSWKLTEYNQWRGFFGLYLPPRELATVQLPPRYEELDDRFYVELETKVEEAVREAVQKARSIAAYITKPDNKVSRLLKALLKETPHALDMITASTLQASYAMAIAPTGESEGDAPARLGERHKLIAELQARHNKEVMAASRADMINGHILALPFSDRYTDAVAEAILNTGIHKVADDRVKYSLAAYVERGGAAFTCCIWVYVCALRDVRA